MNKLVLDFEKKVRSRKLKLAVVGMGYVGFPLALEFAEKKVDVTGIEIDRDRLDSIRKGKSYITDIDSRQLRGAMSRGHFSVSGDFAEVRRADAVLICVPTPLKGKYLPDISFIKNAVKQVALNLKKGSLVILESTTYPGTTEEEILPVFEERGFIHDKDFFLCFSPERIDPGNKKYSVNKIPKVVGGISAAATRLAAAVYRIIIKQVVPVSSSRAAETVKLLENTFRLINIGLIDELAMMAHKMKIDIWEVVSAAATKPFGFMPFYPGPGVGGHCIPKDPLYLRWKAKSFGFNSHFIKLASDVISKMPGYIVQRVDSSLRASGKRLAGAKILILGVTYKKDVKDLRKSPGIDLINILREEGARVSYADHLIPYLKIGKIDLSSLDLKPAEIRNFDCCIIAADHRGVDYASLLKNAKFIFDTRNVFKGKYPSRVERL
ncbi:MAG: nucleotide sugar dehydrogenase [Candidatus Omnitrophica bacterium]|jgi:UDP-N-acetyl-D-glucosamine dehydrogenase|nr:nucleotide sugar dehydrogenase [Candidatus Omnitrophota bacterium]